MQFLIVQCSCMFLTILRLKNVSQNCSERFVLYYFKTQEMSEKNCSEWLLAIIDILDQHKTQQI